MQSRGGKGMGPSGTGSGHTVPAPSPSDSALCKPRPPGDPAGPIPLPPLHTGLPARMVFASNHKWLCNPWWRGDARTGFLGQPRKVNGRFTSRLPSRGWCGVDYAILRNSWTQFAAGPESRFGRQDPEPLVIFSWSGRLWFLRRPFPGSRRGGRAVRWPARS